MKKEHLPPADELIKMTPIEMATHAFEHDLIDKIIEIDELSLSQNQDLCVYLKDRFEKLRTLLKRQREAYNKRLKPCQVEEIHQEILDSLEPEIAPQTGDA